MREREKETERDTERIMIILRNKEEIRGISNLITLFGASRIRPRTFWSHSSQNGKVSVLSVPLPTVLLLFL